MADRDAIAQKVADIEKQVGALEKQVATTTTRLTEMEQVDARLQEAAESTGRALKEISRHWDAVYEALRRGLR